jgi:hypothetical protein
VPRLSFFYGIAVYLYFEDHEPPHVHARYAGSEARVSIVSGEVIEGSLPRRASRLVAEWVNEHSDERAVCWEKAVRGEQPGTIEPLH